MNLDGIVRADLAVYVVTAGNALALGMSEQEIREDLEAKGCKHVAAALHAARVIERIDLVSDLVFWKED